MNTDHLLLLFSCMHYSYDKHVRTNYRINVNQLSILASIYYATKINPKRWQNSVKQCIKRLNPQMNSYYILRDLQILNDRGLIDYNEETPKKYWVKLTKTGKQVIEELFNTESIVSFIEANKDRV